MVAAAPAKAAAAARALRVQLRLESHPATTWLEQQQRLLQQLVVGSCQLWQRRLAVGGPVVSSSRRSKVTGIQK
jgi:hypothetical protein